MTSTQVVAVVVAAIIALAFVAALVRILLNRQDPTWRRIRVGFFVERDRSYRPGDDETMERLEKGFDQD